MRKRMRDIENYFLKMKRRNGRKDVSCKRKLNRKKAKLKKETQALKIKIYL